MSERLPRIVIDACVLANHRVCDILLRLAEKPRLYEPRWSNEILDETLRTLENKLAWPRSLVMYFESELLASFPEAMVGSYSHWIPRMTNDPKDRHVAAAALACSASTIVTFNLRHFQPRDLDKWEVTAMHPQHFLIQLLDAYSDIVRSKLVDQAMNHNKSTAANLKALRKSVPEFVDRLES